MAKKKKTKKRPTKSKRTTSKRAKTTKKVKRPKKVAKKKSAPKRAATKRKARKRQSGERRGRAAAAFSMNRPESRSGGQSGDLQGLSSVESADSESVGELLEEGNAFEADVVTGVERAGDLGEREVHTHEVPEDDVPGEYLDEE